jgi:aromatic ring-opening dioxygenase LigB subunit
MPIGFAGLMCHAPIVIPAVGGDRLAECAATTRAMQRLAARVVEHCPEVLVIVSPHTPRALKDWSLVDGPRIRGDLGAFGAPQARIDLPAATSLRSRLLAHSVPTRAVLLDSLDHGAMVPLWFLAQAGWSGPTLIVGLPWQETTAAQMAQALRGVCALPRAAVVASGDMSHRLAPGAPAGYHPRAVEFDKFVVRQLQKGNPTGLREMDPQLRTLAAEDVVTSTLVAWGAVEDRREGHEVLAYEGPFGVGYCEAVLFDEEGAEA